MKTKMKVTIPDEIQMLCLLLKITPVELLERFMNDLASCNTNQGSDERMMAKEWFLRGEIAYNNDFDPEEIETLVNDLDLLPRGYDKKYLKERKTLLQEWFNEWNKISMAKSKAKTTDLIITHPDQTNEDH